jgi:hypothetical protein
MHSSSGLRAMARKSKSYKMDRKIQPVHPNLLMIKDYPPIVKIAMMMRILLKQNPQHSLKIKYRLLRSLKKRSKIWMRTSKTWKMNSKRKKND